VGELALKNIERPIRAFRVEWDAADWKTTGADAPKPAIATEPTTSTLALPDKPSIAVLPFENMSGDPDQEYFTDGVTEDIITELSRFHSLFVIARNSSFTYKGKSPDIRQVGRELGVRYVLEGSIRKSSNRIRVTCQLIDTLSGNHIWAERYDSVLEDMFAVQEEVTRAIVAAIEPEIWTTERSKVTRRRPVNPSAYEIAFRALVHAEEGGDKADRNLIDLSIREAKEALAIDPNCVRALQMLAYAHGISLYLGTAADREHAMHESISAIARAVELDGSDTYGYVFRALGIVQRGELDRYPEALADARYAHELNPNDSVVLEVLGNLEAAAGEPECAIEHLHQAMRLSPRNPRSYLMYTMLARASFGGKQYAEGIRWAFRAIHEKPTLVMPHVSLTCCLVGAREIDKAKAAFKALQKVASAEWVRSRLEGSSEYLRPADRARHRTFLRIAAGLEEPSAADSLR
jgi:adenylate cyclase